MKTALRLMIYGLFVLSTQHGALMAQSASSIQQYAELTPYLEQNFPSPTQSRLQFLQDRLQIAQRSCDPRMPASCNRANHTLYRCQCSGANNTNCNLVPIGRC